MIRIVPRPGEYIQVTIKRFRKICERDGIIKEVKKHSYFETKSQIRRRKRLKTIRRIQSENRDNSQSGRDQSSNPEKNSQKRFFARALR